MQPASVGDPERVGVSSNLDMHRLLVSMHAVWLVSCIEFAWCVRLIQTSLYLARSVLAVSG